MCFNHVYCFLKIYINLFILPFLDFLSRFFLIFSNILCRFISYFNFCIFPNFWFNIFYFRSGYNSNYFATFRQYPTRHFCQFRLSPIRKTIKKADVIVAGMTKDYVYSVALDNYAQDYMGNLHMCSMDEVMLAKSIAYRKSDVKAGLVSVNGKRYPFYFPVAAGSESSNLIQTWCCLNGAFSCGSANK